MLTPIERERLRIDFELKYPDGDFEHLLDETLDYWENRKILELDDEVDDNPEDREYELEQFSDKLLRKNNGLETTVERLKREKNELTSEIEQKKIMELTEKQIKEDEKELKEVSGLSEEEELKEFTSGVIKDNVDVIEEFHDFLEPSIRNAKIIEREEKRKNAKLIVGSMIDRMVQKDEQLFTKLKHKVHKTDTKSVFESQKEIENLKREYGVNNVEEIFRTKASVGDFIYLGVFIVFILGIIYIFL